MENYLLYGKDRATGEQSEIASLMRNRREMTPIHHHHYYRKFEIVIHFHFVFFVVEKICLCLLNANIVPGFCFMMIQLLVGIRGCYKQVNITQLWGSSNCYLNQNYRMTKTVEESQRCENEVQPYNGKSSSHILRGKKKKKHYYTLIA